MNDLKISYLSNHPAGPEATASQFNRPSWASRPVGLSDSTPRVTTGELRRPVFKTSDSTPRVSTADLPRPSWAKVEGGLGIVLIA